MQSVKKAAAALSAVLALSSVSASAEMIFAGYDTRDLNDIGKVYNEKIGGKYTSKVVVEDLPLEAQEWKFEGYELDYPHAGYDRLYLEGKKQAITRYNNLFPQWQIRFSDFFWELYGEHRIYQRQQTNISGKGWTWDYSDDASIDSQLFVPTTRNAIVSVDYETYGVGPFDFDGNLVSDDVSAMYNRFGVANHEYCYNPETKEITDGTFFSDENLSLRDANGNYVVSDEEIADHAASIMTKVLTGPSYRGDDPRKVLSDEYLLHANDGWLWDDDSLIYGGGKVSWTGVMYEMDEPYLYYQYLIVNGIVFDGHNDLPRIYRYTGGKASPKVEWKYAFAEADPYYNVVEFKYVDGKLALNADGTPIYRKPTGVYANAYAKITDSEIQIWLKDDVADVMVESMSRVDHSKGWYAGFAPGAIWVAN